ncbi:hypothetical protein SDC9_132977 [bioreactor metagenome]|uniref:Uncharacterized protein n=1 Tax=bioreactor metagenome TaxID=1076179 RepID=A0A645D9A2_9ZZZZ
MGGLGCTTILPAMEKNMNIKKPNQTQMGLDKAMRDLNNFI